MNIISLGAGVQSSTMALMAAHGEITPMPEFAVFADTQCEPREVYEWLNILKRLLPFPIHHVTRSNLSEHLFEWNHSQIPAFYNGAIKIGKGKRQCTKHWKIIPVQQEIRRQTNTFRKRLPNGYVALWQGISTDEAARMKESRNPWIKHRWPLIENGVSRSDCLAWMKANSYPKPVKSSCLFCPLQSRAQWKEKKAKGGAEWLQILDVERRLLERGEYLDPKGIGVSAYADSKVEDKPINLFNNECEGMCGI